MIILLRVVSLGMLLLGVVAILLLPVVLVVLVLLGLLLCLQGRAARGEAGRVLRGLVLRGRRRGSLGGLARGGAVAHALANPLVLGLGAARSAGRVELRLVPRRAASFDVRIVHGAVVRLVLAPVAGHALGVGRGHPLVLHLHAVALLRLLEGVAHEALHHAAHARALPPRGLGVLAAKHLHALLVGLVAPGVHLVVATHEAL
mmetsp:Transcript_17774/g.60386  ORF Transcript_17774/g.60386 Transcript_17774/m.60386 type:complete len:203 (+) Transcript_17774:214-822(+)